MDDRADDERFMRLEVKASYLEKLALDLNEVVIAQGQAIDELLERLDRMERQVHSSGEGREFPQEKPPHY